MDNTAKEGMILTRHSHWALLRIHSFINSKPVACGSVIRLQHLQTRLFLHSHNFRSPLSNNQEVSCFGDGSQGDEGMLKCSVL